VARCRSKTSSAEASPVRFHFERIGYRGNPIHATTPPRAFAIATSTGRLNSSFARPGRKCLDRGWRTAGPVRRGIHHAGRAAAKRNPRLLFRFSGVFLLRFAGRQFLGLLFQLPPRITRFEALAVHREAL
jgi:hypothetical protein